MKKKLIGLIIMSLLCGFVTGCGSSDKKTDSETTTAAEQKNKDDDSNKTESNESASKKTDEDKKNNSTTSNSKPQSTPEANQEGKTDTNLEKYKKQLYGTWQGDDGTTFVFNSDGSGSMTVDNDAYMQTWYLAQPKGNYTYIILLREKGASMDVDYYVTVKGDKSLSVITQDNREINLTKK